MKASSIKTRAFAALFITGVFFLLPLLSLALNQDEFTKKFRQEFQVKENTKFILKNKYGQVNINKWDENRILVEVTIRVEANSQEKANRVFDKIDIRFGESGNEASAITEMGTINFKGNFSIDYEVKMPSTVSLDASNKFGDMFIDENRAESEISVEYGGLKANRLLFKNTNPFSNVRIGFGSADIQECSYGKFHVKYSKLNLKTANVAYLITEFSHIRLGEVNSVIADSKYDTYRVEKSHNVVFKGRFSGADFGRVTQKLDVDTEYGNVEVSSLAPDFESITAVSRFANVTVNMPPDASYFIEGKAKFGEIDLPDASERLVKKGDFDMVVKGVVGTNPNPASKVKVDIEYGNAEFD